MSDPAVKPALRIGMVGHAFMGAAHSHAWRTAPHAFDLPLEPELTALAGRNERTVSAAAAKLGWKSTESDWHALIERDDIDLIDICSPGATHAEIAVAALNAGKHVLCEKPLANTVKEAEEMNAAAERAALNGVYAMCGFTYRRTPALALAKRMVDDGRLGTIRHIRAQYLQDWLSDENAPTSWRLDKSLSGSGALGDLGSHLIDAAQWVTGQQITGVSALLKTFVTERPTGGGNTGADGGRAVAPVTVDDAALFSARFTDGPVGVFEVTRAALGRKNAMRLEINGSEGSLAFDFENMNYLSFFDAKDRSNERGFHRIMVTEPGHPYLEGWWPPGHGLGYDHAFTNQAADFVRAVAEGRQPSPSFADALNVQQVLGAVQDSAAESSRWVDVPGPQH